MTRRMGCTCIATGKPGTDRGAGAVALDSYWSYAFGEVGMVRINDCDVAVRG